MFSVGHWVLSVGLNFQSVTHAMDERAKKLCVPPGTLWSSDQDPVLLVELTVENHKTTMYEQAD